MAADSFSDADGVAIDGVALLARIREWALELGFGAIGVADIDLSTAEPGLAAWLEAGFHGEMDYMLRHGMKRARAAELVPGTRRVISARLDYWPAAADAQAVQRPQCASAGASSGRGRSVKISPRKK